MRTLKISCVILIVTLLGHSSLFAQGFQPPAEGKAVIYFVRVHKKGSAINFKYFQQDKFIGKFKGKNYMKHECDPGEHLFWASAENKYFVTANLKEGGVYIVAVEVKMGGFSARVKLTPITIGDELFIKAQEIVNENRPIITPESKIELENAELVEFIAEKLDLYENEWKEKKDFPHISPDMAIPAEKIK